MKEKCSLTSSTYLLMNNHGNFLSNASECKMPAINLTLNDTEKYRQNHIGNIRSPKTQKNVTFLIDYLSMENTVNG